MLQTTACGVHKQTMQECSLEGGQADADVDMDKVDPSHIWQPERSKKVHGS